MNNPADQVIDQVIMSTPGGMIGYLFGQFLIFLVVAAIWLIVTKLIPPLRRRPGVSYGVAMALVLLASLTQIHASSWLVLTGVAFLLCEALLFWQYRRERTKQAKNLAARPEVER